LPGMNGIQAARRILTLAPCAKIIFVTQESADEIVEEAFRLGAYGYVIKTQATKELLLALDAVMSGQKFVSAGLDGHAILNTV